MCGLIGVFNTGKYEKKAANMQALLQFEDQRKRGTEGFGVITINSKMKTRVDRATEPYKFMWDIHNNPSNMIIVHHRTPTSTDNLIGQTHPILVSDGSLKYDYLVTHNGIITNDEDLKKEHEELGFVYKTCTESHYTGAIKFNDSEAFAIELARLVEEQTDEMNISGSAAFIALQIDKKTQTTVKLLFGRIRTTPLIMAKSRNTLFLSSEGKGHEIDEKTLYSCKLEGDMKLTKAKINLKEEEKDEKEVEEEKEAKKKATTEYLQEKFSEKKHRGRLSRELGFKTNQEFNEAYDDDTYEERIASVMEEAKEKLDTILEEYMIALNYSTLQDENDINLFIGSIRDIMEETQKELEEEEMNKTMYDHYTDEAEGKKVLSA